MPTNPQPLSELIVELRGLRDKFVADYAARDLDGNNVDAISRRLKSSKDWHVAYHNAAPRILDELEKLEEIRAWIINVASEFTEEDLEDMWLSAKVILAILERSTDDEVS